jgi:hypothetical protein
MNIVFRRVLFRKCRGLELDCSSGIVLQI